MYKKKSQASLEFILVFSVLTIFVTIFLIMIFATTFEGRIRDNQEVADDMSNFIQQELLLAAKVENGYNRTFLLPAKIGGYDYSISVRNYSLIVNTTKVISLRGIPLIANIKPNGFDMFKSNSNNTIIKNESGIYINPE